MDERRLHELAAGLRDRWATRPVPTLQAGRTPLRLELEPEEEEEEERRRQALEAQRQAMNDHLRRHGPAQVVWDPDEQ